MFLGRRLNKFADSVVSGFDRLILRDTGFEIDPIVSGIHETLLREATTESFGRLDTKAGSLLTHISMMVAAASFMVASEDASKFERVIIGFEITLYLFLALIALRCLIYRDLLPAKRSGVSKLHRYDNAARIEVQTRAQLLNFAFRWVFFLTFVFALTVFAHLIL